MNNTIETINKFLLESEQFSNDFLPLNETLTPIKADIKFTLEELKSKAEASTDIADRVFYLNRYTDLLKKVESIFEARGKRLQQTLQTLSKIDMNNISKDNLEAVASENESLTPEQCNAIIKILNNEKNKE